MKYFLVCFLTFSFSVTANTQAVVQEMKKVNSNKKSPLDSLGWKRTGIFSLSIHQTALSDWPSGGENFIIGIMNLINYSIHHRFGKYSFDAYADVELGFVEASSFKRFRKTTDRCDLSLEFEHTMGKNLFYGFLFNFNSQFLPGYDYKNSNKKISSFLTPGKIILSPGIDKKYISATTFFSFFISPITSRWVLKTDRDFFNTSKFGVDSAHRSYTELGPYLSLHLNHNFSKITSYIGRLDLFSNYRKNPSNVDLLFNSLFVIKISKVFATTFLVDIIYDNDIKSRPQIFENFGLGLRINL